MNAPSSPPVRIYFSFAPGDESFKAEIEKQLYSIPENLEILSLFPGKTDTRYFNKHDIVLILVSEAYKQAVPESELLFYIQDEVQQQIRVMLIELEFGAAEKTVLKELPVLAGILPDNLDLAFRVIQAGIESVIELSRNTKAQESIQQEKSRKSGTLTLSHCNLKRIPFDLKYMPWLEVLMLEANQIGSIEHLDNLALLKKLHLQDNKISVMENLEHLTSLELLDLHQNSIAQVAGLEQNGRLRELGLSGNQLVTLDGIGHLQHLETLYAAHNQLESVAVLSRIRSLHRIVLTNNPLISLKPLRKHIRSGLPVFLKYSFDEKEEGIFVKDCPRLAEPSLEVIEQGHDAVMKYFIDAEKLGTRKLEIIKLILVGNSRVGKSNLSEYLRTGNISEKNNSTHLLDIQGWDAPFLRSEQGTLTHVNIFDFGGQDYYHDAHRMYYSYDTAYILLWDMASNKYDLKEEQVPDKEDALQYEDFPLEYWLESIKYNLDKKSFYNYYSRTEADSTSVQVVAPVLVVQNKIDIAEGLLDQAGMQSKYPNIKQFFNLSLKENKRTAILSEVLSDYMKALNLSGRQLLLYEYELVEAFRKKSEESPEILTLESFGERCRELISNEDIVFNKDNAEILAQILNNTGIFFYDRHKEGGGHIYTNIRVLNERIKAIMDVARRGNDKGIFHEDQVKHVEGYEPILDLLCRNNSVIRINENRYVAPQFLPLKPDDAIAFFLQAFTFTQVRYVYKAYFHKTLLLNLFARYLDKENVDISAEGFRFFPFWRNGIIIKRDKGAQKEWVLVEFEKNKEAAVGVVNIRTMTPFRKGGLEGEIERSLDELNEGWTVEKQVSVNSTEFFCLSDLQQKVGEKQFTFYKNDKLFSINDFKQIASFEKLPKKLFISYSSRNSEFIKRFVTHLDVFKANGDIEPWYDRMIDPGTRWDESIRREMHSSDVVIFLLSPDFLATEYIMKTEIPLAIKQAEQTKINFFFIQLQDCLWDRTELGRFQQTADASMVNKNVISIGQPDNHEKWLAAIRGLERVMNGIRVEQPVPAMLP